MEEKEISNNKKSGNEIDLIELSLKYWAERRFILKVIVGFLVLGILLLVTSRKEYRTELSLISESTSSSTSGMFQQLSNLAGVNLSNTEKDPLFNPALYPAIIESTPFLMDLIHETVYDSQEDKDITIYEYILQYEKKSFIKILKEYTIGLPKKIFKSMPKDKQSRNNQINEIKSEKLQPTEKERFVINVLKNRTHLKLEQTGIISLSVEMMGPVAAYDMINIVKSNLTDYLTEYKISKVKEDLEFTKERFEEAERNFQIAQSALAKFRDKNKNLISSFVKNEEERLRSDYNIKFNIYNQLATSLEQGKIRIQEEKPMFKVIETPAIPSNNFKPKVLVYIFGFIFLGFFFSMIFITFKMIVKHLKILIELKQNKT
ncbi:MAG: hypothetical protein WD577_08910 [Bacteroidales bacterium]